MVQLAQGFPKLNAALVTLDTGNITQPWLQFLIALWNRTGGSAPSGFVTSVSLIVTDGITGSVVNPGSTVQITLGLGSITPTSVTASGTVIGSNLSGINTGDVTLTGENYLSIIGQTITVNAVDLSGTNVMGILAAARFPALTGAITTIAGSVITSLSNNAVTTSSIAANAVTNPKMATNTANTLAGYDGTGTFSDVAIGSNLTLTAGTLNTTGISAIVTTAKLTAGGANGSMTFSNGVLTAQTPAT